MRKYLVPLFLLPFLGCKEDKIRSKEVFPTVSYLDIRLDSNGHLPANPYVLTFRNGNKQIVFCGVEHLSDPNDTNNAMYKAIEARFFDFKPDVAINEGGDVSHKVYTSKTDAIVKDAEIGLIKVLCDSAHIETVDGDPSFETEYKDLREKYTTGEILSYITTERLMWGLKSGPVPDSAMIEDKFSKFIQGYFIRYGKAPLSASEQQLNFYKVNYEKLLGRPFSLEHLEPTNPFDSTEKFQAIGRYSKEVRDQFLLKKIDSLLDSHDRVFVVFGGWHLLTCEPGLNAIIKRK